MDSRPYYFLKKKYFVNIKTKNESKVKFILSSPISSLFLKCILKYTSIHTKIILNALSLSDFMRRAIKIEKHSNMQIHAFHNFAVQYTNSITNFYLTLQFSTLRGGICY